MKWEGLAMIKNTSAETPESSVASPACDAAACRCPFVRFRHIGLVLVAFGLLFWARFLLVTGHPRTAIADPPLRGQTQSQLESQLQGQSLTGLPSEATAVANPE